MSFDQESKSEEKTKLFEGVCGGGGVGRGAGAEFRPKQNKKKKKPKKKPIDICLYFVLMLYITFQVPGSGASLVLIQTKGVTDR